mgnify:CR=1 FL=1
MNRDRAVCRRCGMHSGLDDLVHNALYGGIHGSSSCWTCCGMGPRAPVRSIASCVRTVVRCMKGRLGGVRIMGVGIIRYLRIYVCSF